MSLWIFGRDSPTRFEWMGVELTRENGVALFIPPQFAHGFISLVDETDVLYHMGDFYRPASASGVRYNDLFSEYVGRVNPQ